MQIFEVKNTVSLLSDKLWLNVSPSLSQFDQPLLNVISEKISIAEWQYIQDADEPLSLEIALNLLHEYCQVYSEPIHLLGHSTSGLLAWLYAQRYPEKVRSLTLLSVGAYLGIDWQIQYYSLLSFLPCSRKTILKQMVNNMFGNCCNLMKEQYVSILQEDLNTSLSPHNLYQHFCLTPETIPIPLFICGGQNDLIIDQNLLNSWYFWLKKGDRLWECPTGGHFFHYFHPLEVSQQICQFWDSI